MGQIEQFILHHWILWAALLVLLILILMNELISQKKAPQLLSPQATVKKINHDNAVIFDIRDKNAYTAGHIIGAIHASSADFDQPRMDKYKSKPIVLVCTKGIQTQSLAAKLKSKGFTDVAVLNGGITAWQTAELPLVKGTK